MRCGICRMIFNEKPHLGDLKKRVRSHVLLRGIKLSHEYSDISSNKAMIELNLQGTSVSR